MPKKKEASSLFDWCRVKDHSPCTGRYEKFYFDHKRGKTILTMTGEFVDCGCKCHRKDKK